MSHILNKSEQNLKAAGELILIERYASSVHCSYFSIIQLYLHALLKEIGITFEEDSDEEHTLHSNRLSKSKHADAFKIIHEKINDKHLKFQHYTNFKDLQQFRTSSDYFNTEIKKNSAESAQNICKNIKGILTKSKLI
ncbi:MAG: HEPN domain-containing protein [Bacteroidota bacterium]